MRHFNVGFENTPNFMEHSQKCRGPYRPLFHGVIWPLTNKCFLILITIILTSLIKCYVNGVGNTAKENTSTFSRIKTCQQGHLGSKTVLQQNPPVLNWGCRLIMLTWMIAIKCFFCSHHLSVDSYQEIYKCKQKVTNTGKLLIYCVLKCGMQWTINSFCWRFRTSSVKVFCTN